MSTELLSVLDVAERWKCSPSHVRRLIRTGQLECVRLGERLIRIRASALEAFVASTTKENAN